MQSCDRLSTFDKLYQVYDGYCPKMFLKSYIFLLEVFNLNRC